MNQWPLVKLGEVLKERMDVVHPRDNPSGEAHFVGLEHIEPGTGLRIGQLAVDKANLTGRKPSFRKGDIVYGYLRPYLNKVWMAEFDGLCSVDQYVFTADATQVDAEYVAHFMRSPAFLLNASVHLGPGQLPRIRRREVAAVSMPRPPLDKQKQIAAKVSAAMAEAVHARSASRSRFAASRSLPGSILGETFRNLGRKVEVRPFDECCDLLSAHSIKKDGDAVVRALTTACLTETGFDPAGIKDARMASEDVAAATMQAGEVLIARSNTPELVGRVSEYLEEPPGVVAPDLVIRIRFKPLVRSSFLTAYLSSLYLSGYWKDHAGGASGSMKKITRTQLRRLEIPCPSLPDQDAILSNLSVAIEDSRRMGVAVAAELAAIQALPTRILAGVFDPV